MSEHFVLVSRRKVRQLLERDLSQHNFCAIYIDGIEYQGQHLIVALGMNNDGVKTVLGLRQGASENYGCRLRLVGRSGPAWRRFF